MPKFTWTTDPGAAIKEQLTLREVLTQDRSRLAFDGFKRGLAIGSAYDENSKCAVSAAFPFDEHGRSWGTPFTSYTEVDFPYVAGLLAFRVGPAICKMLDEIEDDFDLLLFDGQGIAHPRGMGLAAHIGVLYNKMSIGVTKNNLFGRALAPPSSDRLTSTIVDPKNDEVVGHTLTLGTDCPPIYVSPGHLLTANEAVRIVRQISRTDSCFPPCLARAHGRANSLARRVWRERVE